MASKGHQMIAGLIARKMRMEGYGVISFDGNESIISQVLLSVPPQISRHRPDLIGVNLKDKAICIGEAKTELDLKTKRTEEQLTDFSNITTTEGNLCNLIIGVPQSAIPILKDVLTKIGIKDKKNISYVYLPDELLNKEDDD